MQFRFIPSVIVFLHNSGSSLVSSASISLRNICVIIQTAKDYFLRPCEEYAAAQFKKKIFR